MKIYSRGRPQRIPSAYGALDSHQASNVLINAAENGDLERALQLVKTDPQRAGARGFQDISRLTAAAPIAEAFQGSYLGLASNFEGRPPPPASPKLPA